MYSRKRVGYEWNVISIQANVENPVLPEEVLNNDFFSESDTGVEG